jgi:type VI protein secretion system component Hcp
MKHLVAAALASSAALTIASPALAASDYLLEIEGVKGEAAATIEINSWSWGVSNPAQASSHEVKSPRDAASGLATGKRQHMPIRIVRGSAVEAPRDAASGQATGKRSSIAIDESGVHRTAKTSPTKPDTDGDGGFSIGEPGVQADGMGGPASGSYAATKSKGGGQSGVSDLILLREGAAGGVNVAVGDVNGDGLVDFADTDGATELAQFTLTFDKATPKLMESCAKGTHFPKATIKTRTASYVLENAVVASCTTGQPRIVENQRTGDQMPNRISMNVTTPKQTQGATFGEKVNQGMQAAGSAISMTVTGQLRHTKSGHVTLLK